ncbi:hypothetical protein Glove_543g84 [Diversispora epigaea]|uniref:ARS-binding protein 1 N-terminal domain-containing protein n=1 Tax=Diversispora epigaea TaxID=1348612 RepID=A0A397GCE7_9GLOM|nr:hypothetical protein Glove_543g84 [Diversispora epigaea]
MIFLDQSLSHHYHLTGLVSSKKNKRQAITEAQRTAIYKKKHEDPGMTQSDIQRWTEQEFDFRINQSTISKILKRPPEEITNKSLRIPTDEGIIEMEKENDEINESNEYDDTIEKPKITYLNNNLNINFDELDNLDELNNFDVTK